MDGQNAASAPGVSYRKSDGAIPTVRERDGQVVSPGLVLHVAEQAFSGGGDSTLSSLCAAVAETEECTLAADSSDLIASVDTLLRRWHAGGWLAATKADGTPSPVRKSGGVRKAARKATGLGDSERVTAPMGAILTWLMGDGDEQREVRHTLARAEDILVSVVSPAVVCAHVMDVLIRQPQSAKTCKLYAVAAQLTQLVTGTHVTHTATFDTLSAVRAFDAMSDDEVVAGLAKLDVDAIASVKKETEDAEEGVSSDLVPPAA